MRRHLRRAARRRRRGESGALSLPERLGNAAVALVAYLGMFLRPVGLAVFYPHPGAPPPFVLGGSVLLLLALTWGAWHTRRRFPFLLVGWLWFVGSLVPVIGLVQVGEQALADRYTYVPYVGLSLALAEGARQLLQLHALTGRALVAAGGAFLLALVPVAREQVGTWHDSVTLFRHALEVTRDNHVAERLLGAALLDSGDATGAEPHLREAVRLRPGSAAALNALGVALTRLSRPGDAEAALEAFRRAAAADPGDPDTRNNLGNSLEARGNVEGALAEYGEAIRLAPEAPPDTATPASPSPNWDGSRRLGTRWRRPCASSPATPPRWATWALSSRSWGESTRLSSATGTRCGSIRPPGWYAINWRASSLARAGSRTRSLRCARAWTATATTTAAASC